MISRLIRDRKGQGMVEYGLLIAGVALVGIVGVSLLGHKSSDLIGTTASIMPGAHDDDGGSVYSGHLVQTTDTGGVVTIDTATIAAQAASDTSVLDANMGLGPASDQSFVTDNISDATGTAPTTFTPPTAP